MTSEKIADLLAHRDGERLNPATASEIEADAASRSELAVLRQLKHELNELPFVAPPADAWANIQARTRKPRNRFASFNHRFPLATAATVCLMAMLGIVVWDPANLQRGEQSQPAVVADLSASALNADGARFAALVDRSQQLESALLYRGNKPPSWTPDQEALLYRIADLDSELIAARDEGLMSLEEREALWQQRVQLLEALAQSRRARAQSVVF